MSHKNREASLYIMVLVSYLQSVGLRCDDDDMTRRGVGRVRGRWAYLSICNWTLSEGKPKQYCVQFKGALLQNGDNIHF
eukprot:scaffold7176_cov165-Alexandrium_tamarense.AAC.5